MFYTFNDIECLYNDLEYFMLSNVSKARPYIYLVTIVKWKRKEHRLDLALTIHNPLLCGPLLAHCQYLHRFNIVRVGHPTLYFHRICEFKRYDQKLIQ